MAPDKRTPPQPGGPLLYGLRWPPIRSPVRSRRESGASTTQSHGGVICIRQPVQRRMRSWVGAHTETYGGMKTETHTNTQRYGRMQTETHTHKDVWTDTGRDPHTHMDVWTDADGECCRIIPPRLFCVKYRKHGEGGICCAFRRAAEVETQLNGRLC